MEVISDAERGVEAMGLLATAPIVEYRKSGLSLNHVVGCPLDCAYCVRHLFGNYEMKHPRLLVDDGAAVWQLMAHWAFRRDLTPIQIFNRATDPFLPNVKEHMFRTLELLDEQGLTNPVLVITRWRVTEADVARLDALRSLRVTLLVTWSGIEDARIEPVDSGEAELSLRIAHQHAGRIRVVLYWRPLVAGLNDSPSHVARALALSHHAHATVFTGLFHRAEIKAYFDAAGLPSLYDEVARRKILPLEVERRVLEAFAQRPLFRKTSCAVSFVHGLPDYNGHVGIPSICDICPVDQLGRCSRAHVRPAPAAVAELAQAAGLDEGSIEVLDGFVRVAGSTEQQRYFVQHSLNHQVHDASHPHLPRRHGRAEVGWP